MKNITLPYGKEKLTVQVEDDHLLEVLGYTLIGIVYLMIALYPMEYPAFHPTVQIDIGHPLSPLHLQCLIEPCTHGLRGSGAHCNDKGFEKQFPYKIDVISCKSIEEVLVPVGKPCSDADYS